MRHRLKGLDIEIIGLADLEAEVPRAPEDGCTPVENAAQKALTYYEAFHMPVFSCDSGLYFKDLPDDIQPGVHVRTIGGRSLSDAEMIAYYSGLAKTYGNIKARYRNAICLVMDMEHKYQAMDEDMASEEFLMISKPHKILREGVPLDSLSVDISTGKYFYEMEEGILDQVMFQEGFFRFFQRIFA